MKRSLLGAVLAVAALGAMAQTPATISPSAPLPVYITGGATMAAAVGDTKSVSGGTAVQLFGGATPATGFEIQVLNNGAIWFSDVGTAAPNGPSLILQGGQAGGGSYRTPPGYVPGGPVSVISNGGTAVISARSW